jgi:hypothetical protein
LTPLTDAEWISQRDYWAGRHATLGGWLAEHCALRPVAEAMGLSLWNQ